MSAKVSPLGGGLPGISPKQTINNKKDSEQTAIRSILRRAWNTRYATNNVNGYGRAIGEFKAVNNIGDYLSRQNYACGNIPNATRPNIVNWGTSLGSIIKHCDGTGVPCSNTNTRFVPDSSDYTTYRKQRAINRNYNDATNGGDQHNASYVATLAVRRF
jgi:hypothetical protein